MLTLEVVHMSEDIDSKLGAEVECAIATIPSSFCGPIRDPHKMQQSQYKIYKWMALLHWYTVPIAWELKSGPMRAEIPTYIQRHGIHHFSYEHNTGCGNSNFSMI